MIAILSRENPLARTLALSAASLLGAAATGLLALVEIPIPGTPVPMTLQTFSLLAGAGLLTRGYALQMSAWYLLIGIAGAPFFAGGVGGWRHLAGPTGGYLLGFVIAAAVVGYLADRRASAWRNAHIFLGATVSIYVPGLLQLKLVTGADWPQTFAMGFAPFIAGDAVKALAAWGGVTLTRRWLL